MRERPILFQGAMVRALLAGTKSQTRRAIKPQPPAECGIHYMLGNESWLPPEKRAPLRHHWEAWGGPLYRNRPPKHLCGSHDVRCPYGSPGDRLYVREAHCYVGPGSGSDLPSYVEEARDPKNHKPENCWYRADGERGVVWTPGIHMFRGLSRILLEITEVRVQRLQEISEEDAAAEGCPCFVCGRIMDGRSEDDCHCFHRKADARDYRDLWESINGHKPEARWDANPWVWALSFKRVQP